MKKYNETKPGVWIPPTDIAYKLSCFYKLLDVDVGEISFKAVSEIITSFMKVVVSHILKEVNDRETVSLFDQYNLISGDDMCYTLGGSNDANDLWYDMQTLAKKIVRQYPFRENTYYKPIVVGNEKNFIIFLREEFDIWKFHGMRLNKKLEEEKELEECSKSADEAEIELLKEEIKMLRDKIEVLEFDKQKLLFTIREEVLDGDYAHRYPK